LKPDLEERGGTGASGFEPTYKELKQMKELAQKLGIRVF